MQLIIIRHGESEDDLINAYGGWADFPLTDNGREQVNKTAHKLESQGAKVDVILSSPLKRATESAQIIGQVLNTKVEVFEYIKERNTYGILCGMIKIEAKEKYPWIVEAYENGNYVEGSEREEDIKHRVKKAYELIAAKNISSVAIVTHGVFLKAFVSEVLGKKLVKKEDAGFIILNIESNTIDSKLTVEVLQSEGIEIQ
jgi:broad specificity phosphatase PhoE